MFYKLIKIINGTIPNVDLHMHTNLTDGNDTLEAMIEKACELGLDEIAFTEHAANWSPWIAELDDMKKTAEKYSEIKVYFAAETKVVDWNGKIDLDKDKIKLFDFIVGVVHSYPKKISGFHLFDDLDAAEAMYVDYELTMGLLSNNDINVWGHPCGVYANYYGAYSKEMLDKLVNKAVENGIAIEINANNRYRTSTDMIWKSIKKHENCTVSIGSDAHSIKEIGQITKYLEEKKNNA